MEWFCHQIPERSLLVGGEPFFLCSRCTGIYMGAFLMFLLTVRVTPPVKPALVLFAVGILSAVLEWGGVIHTGNETRFVLGFGLGTGLLGVLQEGKHPESLWPLLFLAVAPIILLAREHPLAAPVLALTVFLGMAAVTISAYQTIREIWT